METDFLSERWRAPADTSAIALSTGTLTVIDGHVALPADAGTGDRLALAANGFRRAVPIPDPAPAKVATRRASIPETPALPDHD